MKNKLAIIFLLAGILCTYGQTTLRAGMGINLSSIPSLKDYINQNGFVPYDNQLGSFSTAVNFSGEADFTISPSFELGVEAAYTFNSFSNNAILGKYEFSYGIFMPSVTAYYVISGEGYNFKFGGGVGPRFTSVSQVLPPVTASTSYTSTGFGLLARIDGNTALSSAFYANIGGDIRYDINGSPSAGGTDIINNASSEKVNLNTFSIGIRLGISYIF